MRIFTCILLLTCCGHFLKGQPLTVTGQIAEEKNPTPPIANVLLLQTDSTFLSGTTTDEQGRFSFRLQERGSFLLKVQAIGYETLFKKIEVQGDTEMDRLTLTPVTYMLKDVEVRGKTPMVRREADRIVFDTKHVASAINATDLLHFTPGVIVNGEEISIFGAQGVKFYINGKEQKLSSKEILQMLKSYPAADVENIELITSPSARYAAEGKAGIIHLKLKKQENNFVGGNVSYARTQYREEGDQLNTGINYNKGKLSSSLHAGVDREDTPYRETNTQNLFTQRKSATDHGLIDKRSLFFKGQIDYAWNDQWTTGGQLLYNRGRRNLDVNGESEVAQSGMMPELFTRSMLGRKEETNTTAVNLNAEQKIGKLGKTIWYNIDYYRLNFDEKMQSHAQTADAAGVEQENIEYHNIVEQQVHNYSGKIDASLPWQKNRINLGTHFSHTGNRRSLLYSTTLLPAEQQDRFHYNEYVWALYTEYQRKFSDRWSMNTGLRMEATWSKGKSKTTHDVHHQAYVRLFPSLFVGYTPSPRHSLNFSLIHQVTRPNINHVNPNTIQRDRYNASIGNPYLRPSYFYKGNLGYTYKGSLSFDLFYSYQPQAMSQVADITSDMVRTTRWENCIDTQTLGVNSFYFFNRLQWLSLTCIQGLYWEHTYSSSVYTLPRKRNFNYTAVVHAQLFFDTQRKFVGTISGSFNSKQKNVTTELEPLYRIDAGLQYNCLNNRLNIGLTCRNLIASSIRGKEYANKAVMCFSNKYQYLMPRLSLTYQWGAKLRTKRHELEAEKMKQRVANDF